MREQPGGSAFEAHYPTEDAALDAAIAQGWLVGSDGQLWCSACGQVLTCEAEGHQFSPWRPVLTYECPELGREYRYCLRCCLHESRRAAQLVVSDAGPDTTSATGTCGSAPEQRDPAGGAR